MVIILQSCLAGSRSEKAVTQAQAANPSYILHEKARQYYWAGQTSLSIKTFFSGQALYSLGKGYCAVNDTSYLLVNHDQPYTITIEANEAVEAFCLFFEPGLVEEIYSNLVTPPDRLLDDPERPAIALHFFERTYQHDDLVSPLLLALRTLLPDHAYEQGWLCEQFHELIQRLLQVHLNVYKEIEALPALRASTREELYRRLYRARDYALALVDTSVTLNDMARIASLSPNHFLRTFKQVFHQTPHQYLIKKRLEMARNLLVSTNRSVTDIGMDLGFESSGSFSRLFHQHAGCSPTQYRAKKSDF